MFYDDCDLGVDSRAGEYLLLCPSENIGRWGGFSLSPELKECTDIIQDASVTIYDIYGLTLTHTPVQFHLQWEWRRIHTRLNDQKIQQSPSMLSLPIHCTKFHDVDDGFGSITRFPHYLHGFLPPQQGV